MMQNKRQNWRKQALIQSLITFSIFFVINTVFCFDTEKVLILTDKKVVQLEAMLADTPETWQQGLIGFDGLEDNQGMLFVFPREAIQTFTTRNVSFPIDIILINKENRIISIFDSVSGPKNYAFPLPILSALEVKAGFCLDNDISIGDLVKPVDLKLRSHGEIRDEEKEREKVEKKLIQNIDNHPDDPQVYEELAVFYTISRECEKAIEVFEKLLKLGETAPRLNGMGAALGMCHRNEEAEIFFKKAIEKDPVFASSYNNLALLYLRENNKDQANELFQKLKSIYPDNIQSYIGLARIALGESKLEAANDIILSAEKQGIHSPDLQRLKGDISLRKGQFEHAADLYLDYLRERPYDEHASELRSFIMNYKIRKKQLEQ